VTVRIRRSTLSAVVSHARHEAPRECCGLLVGKGDLIDEAVAARNLSEHPSRYRIDPLEHIATNRRLRGTQQSVIGAYHSHTDTGAIPSPRDVAEAYYPEFVWLIVSLASDVPDCRAYRIENGRADELSLIVE
jgi:proteasome lid subunit RPN8/RPN11